MHTANIAFPNLKIGALCLLGYGFDNAWEIVPGVWTEQIWYQDRMLAERTFTVSKPERGDRFSQAPAPPVEQPPRRSYAAPQSANSDRPSVEKHPNAPQAEFGFLEAVRHCNDAIGEVRNVKHVDAKLSKYVTNRWPIPKCRCGRAAHTRTSVRLNYAVIGHVGPPGGRQPTTCRALSRVSPRCGPRCRSVQRNGYFASHLRGEYALDRSWTRVSVSVQSAGPPSGCRRAECGNRELGPLVSCNSRSISIATASLAGNVCSSASSSSPSRWASAA